MKYRIKRFSILSEKIFFDPDLELIGNETKKFNNKHLKGKHIEVSTDDSGKRTSKLVDREKLSKLVDDPAIKVSAGTIVGAALGSLSSRFITEKSIKGKYNYNHLSDEKKAEVDKIRRKKANKAGLIGAGVGALAGATIGSLMKKRR